MRANRIFRWLVVLAALLLLALPIASFIVIKTPWFHRYILSRIIEEGAAATGGRLELQNWDLRFSPLTVDFYGITLHGSEMPTAKPLLQADKITVSVSLSSLLLHRQLKFTQILVQHPVASLQIAENGSSNIPSAPRQQTGSNASIWDLAVAHALLSQGEVYYNDRKSQLDADLYDLRSEIRFDALATRYTGSLSYHNGRLQYGQYRPLPHSLDAKFTATPQNATLDSLLVSIGSSRLSAHGDLTSYSNPTINAAYQLQLHAQDFRDFSPDIAAAGDLTLDGGVRYQSSPSQPFLRSISVDGTGHSSSLRAASAQGGIELHSVKARYRLADGDLEVSGVGAEIAGGHLSAELAIHHLDSTPAGMLHASLQRVRIESARQSINRVEVKRMPVTGTADARVQASWTGSLNNMHALSDLTLRAAIWNSLSNPAAATPVNGTVHLAYDAPRNMLTLHQTELRSPLTSVILDGELSHHSGLQVHVTAGDVHELAVLASSLRPSTPPAISGSAKLDAVVQGDMRSPHLSAQLDAHNLQAQGSQWKSARLALKASPSSFEIQQGSLVSARQGDLSFSAQVGLTHWSYLPSSPIKANLSARGISVAALLHLANLSYPVTGDLSAEISLQGSQLNPAGHGSVRIIRASAYDQPVQSLALQFQGDRQTIDARLNLELPAGSASGDFSFTPQSKTYKVKLSVPGIALRKLQLVQAGNLPLEGTFTADISGAGTLDNPQLDARLEVPALQLRQTAVTGMKAQLTVHNHRADFSLGSNITQTFVRAQGTIDLTGAWNAQASVDTNRIPLETILPLYAPGIPPGFHGETELHASLKGPLKDKSRLEAHITIPMLDAAYGSAQFASAGPIRADYSQSVVTLQPAEIRGTDTSLHFQGRIPLQEAAAMSLQAQGAVNLRLLSLFSQDLRSSGALEIDIRGTGTLHNPALQGKIQLNNAAFSTSTAPVSLSKLNGTVDLAGDRLQISNFSGEVGGGQLTAGGSVVLRPAPQFDLALQAKSIRLLYPDGVRTLLDSNLAFTGNMQAARLTGRTLIQSINFTPDFDLASFATQFNGTSVPPLGQSFAANVKLAILVQSAQNLAARSSQLSVEGAANLQVVGTLDDPVIVGRADLTGGELFFRNNRYQLQRGIIAFDNPNQTRPVLNLQVTTTIQQYNLTLTLTGPIDRLTTNYASDPALSTADIISLLYRGQTNEVADAAGTSTDSILASQAAGQFSSGLQKLAGISSLQIDPLIGGNNSNPSARIAIQQRVTRNFLFTFSTDVSQPESEIVQGEYQINRHWSVSVARDQIGGISIDGRFHTKF